MKKAYRVKKERDFQRIIQHHHSVANKNLVLFTLQKPGQAHFRVGLSVGKRIGNAVKRNRVKRQLRVSVQHIQEELPNELDIVIIARPHCATLTTEEIEKNVRHVCQLAQILK